MTEAPVIVTGALGLVGGSVMQACRDAGWNALGLARAEDGEGEEDVLSLDWIDPMNLSAILSDLGPRAIIHCAGMGVHAGSTVRLTDLYDANVGLVSRLLASLPDAWPGKIVIVSSAAVYGPQAEAPIPETAPLRPASHYGVTKQLAEETARAFFTLQGTRIVIARPFNVIGGVPAAASVLGAILRQVAATGHRDTVALSLLETRSVRDFVDVRDVARALMLLAEQGEAGEAYNVCTGEGTTIKALVDSIARVSGMDVEVTEREPSMPPSVSIGASTKLLSLGWSPTLSLDESIADAMERVLTG